MAIFLRESDVDKLATMKMAIDAVEEAFRLQAEQKADNAPRRRCRLDKGLLHVMSASLSSLSVGGVKAYTTMPGGNRFYVQLVSASSGEMLAIIEADRLGQLRTGAASAVATKYMSRAESSRLGILGSGRQARTQLEGVCAVRPIKTIVAYSPDRQHLEEFCKEMTDKLKLGVYPASGPEEAVKEMDIVITATTSKEPVFKGEWLAKGTHINAIGANLLSRQELDVESIRRSACVVVDSVDQSRLESGDLARAADEEAFYWEDARELSLVVTGEFPGREDDSEITLFRSHGIALEDVALGRKIYEAARKGGLGEQLPL